MVRASTFEPETSGDASRGAAGARRPALLLVDDLRANLVALDATLEPLGARRVWASSGQEALERLGAGEFALVVLDAQMPGLDGFDTLARLRELERSRPAPTPVLFVTAIYGEPRHVARAYALGAADFITKPFDPLALRAKVGVFLELYEAREEARRRGAADERAEGLLDLLARASEALAPALRADAVLADFLRVAVPEFADWCAVQGGEPEGPPVALARAHADPSLEAKLEAMLRRHRLREAAPHDHPDAPRAGAPEPPAELSADALAAVARDPEQLAALRALGTESAVFAPLVARGRPLGTLAFARGPGRRRFDPADLRAAGELARRVAFALDNARLYEEVERARDRAEGANLAKDEFLAVVSHELRSPLNAVIGWAKLLRSGEIGPEKYARAFEVIETNAELQAKLVDDLLDVARVTAGTLSLRLEPVRLGDAAREALDAARPAAEAKGVRLEARLDERDRVRGDPDRLRQVATNLLTNAVKFTPPGGRVEVRVAPKNRQISLEVVDTGRGIAPAFLPHVFERFRQADAGRPEPKGGLGLGLSIVKSLVELHGGAVTAHSEGEGRGATFTVLLPAEGPPGEPERPPPPAPGPAARDPRRPLAGLRLLVVEDEEDARDLMVALLGSRGAQVEAASGAAEAFELLQELRPDVLVSDIAMPGEDGYSLLRRVRELAPEAGGATPALAVSAFVRPEDRARAMQAGFGLYVTKPVDPAELVAALLRLSGRAPAA
ncbi:MAG TPA: response regulator [Polyangiaceae bacterium]|nr:response regulator [Polyangiaceae bacterium]